MAIMKVSRGQPTELKHVRERGERVQLLDVAVDESARGNGLGLRDELQQLCAAVLRIGRVTLLAPTLIALLGLVVAAGVPATTPASAIVDRGKDRMRNTAVRAKPGSEGPVGRIDVPAGRQGLEVREQTGHVDHGQLSRSAHE